MSSASRGTSQQRSTGAQPPAGAKARSAEPICPYSFVPISQSLTPELSARTLRALESQGFKPTERKVTVADFGSTRFTAKTAFEKRKPGIDYCAVRVLQNGVSSLAESNTQLSDTQRAERVKQGLIVGELIADPRFATRDMWQTGEINEFDRARMFWRMAWLAENKEDKLVGLSRIQIADLRSMEDLQLMWQEVDAKIPFLGTGRTGATASSATLRSSTNTFQSQGAGQRSSSPSDAGESEYEPSKPGFPWVAGILGAFVGLVLGGAGLYGWTRLNTPDADKIMADKKAADEQRTERERERAEQQSALPPHPPVPIEKPTLKATKIRFAEIAQTRDVDYKLSFSVEAVSEIAKRIGRHSVSATINTKVVLQLDQDISKWDFNADNNPTKPDKKKLANTPFNNICTLSPSIPEDTAVVFRQDAGTKCECPTPEQGPPNTTLQWASISVADNTYCVASKDPNIKLLESP